MKTKKMPEKQEIKMQEKSIEVEKAKQLIKEMEALMSKVSKGQDITKEEKEKCRMLVQIDIEINQNILTREQSLIDI